MPDPGSPAARVNLSTEVSDFAAVSVADRIALGDQDIRRQVAFYIIWLFVGANVSVMFGVGVAYWQDCVQLSEKVITPQQRIVDSRVVMAMLGATTVQLGTVIYTITRAIFPTPAART